MANDYWGTPLALFRRIQREMDVVFTLDPCAAPENRLGIEKFFTEKENGLRQSWRGEIVYMNPPYSRGNIDKWTMKASEEAFARLDTVVVGLLPLRTAQWFRRSILPFAKILQSLSDWQYLPHQYCGIYFLEKRVRFIDSKRNAPIPGSPNFDSFLAVWV